MRKGREKDRERERKGIEEREKEREIRDRRQETDIRTENGQAHRQKVKHTERQREDKEFGRGERIDRAFLASPLLHLS